MRIDIEGVKVVKSLDGTAYLFEEHFGFIYLLNETGFTLSTKLIEGEQTEDDLVAAVMTEFENTEPDVVREDVREFIGMLREYALLP